VHARTQMQMRSASPSSSMAPTVHAYTAAMRAATEGGRWARALDIWADLRASGCQTTGVCVCLCAMNSHPIKLVRVCFASFLTLVPLFPLSLLLLFAAMGDPFNLAASLDFLMCVPMYTAGHAYAAAISACAAGQQWQRAVALFDDMAGGAGIRPDVVSCTALVRDGCCVICVLS